MKHKTWAYLYNHSRSFRAFVDAKCKTAVKSAAAKYGKKQKDVSEKLNMPIDTKQA